MSQNIIKDKNLHKILGQGNFCLDKGHLGDILGHRILINQLSRRRCLYGIAGKRN